MLQKSLSFLCALALVMGMIAPISGTVHAAADTTCSACGATNVEWTTLTADTVPEVGVHYRLTGKVEKSGQWSLKDAGTYCIDLAGQTISTTSRAFIAGDNDDKPAVTLNIMDSSANQSGMIKGKGNTGATWSAGVLYSCEGAIINIYGGTVTTTDVNTASAAKGGVATVKGELNMYGGTIIGGTAQTYGGAVYLNSGVFTMSGGAVKSGTAPYAPCVLVSSGSRMVLSGDAEVDQIYLAGTMTDGLTVRGTYTGSATVAAATDITSGTAIATAENADISGATISVAGTNLAASVSGKTIIVGDGHWCEACKKNVVWQNLGKTLPTTASGHYRLTGDVGADQAILKSGNKVCLDLAGYSYNVSKRAFVLGTNNTSTNGEVLNVMDSSVAQTGRLVGQGGSADTAAGVIYNYKNTTLNIYGGTIEAQGKGDVIAKNGGALDTYGTINMYGGTVIGNRVANNGGAVCLLGSVAVFNMEGGTVVTGKADDLGDCVYVTSGCTMKLSGNASPEQIYFAGSSANKLIISGDYTGKTELKFATTPTSGTDIGNCSKAVGKECISIADTRLYAAVSGSNLVVAALTGASVTDTEGAVTYHDTLSAALATKTNDSVIKLLSNNAENVTVSGDTVLDLNGWDVTGDVTVSNGALYVKDSATDDYTVNDLEGYGVISGKVTGSLEAAENYFALDNSFHKYILKISKVNLRPGSTGIYYSAEISMDETIQALVDNYGIAVSVNTNTPAVDSAESYYTVGANSVLISNIMDGDFTDEVDAATLIYGRPYIRFKDATCTYGDVCATNLQQLTEVVDAKAWGKTTLAQHRALMAMYDTYAAEMEKWAVTNMAGSVAKKQAAADDGVLKAIVIGNSASSDAISLLAAIFQTEAPDQEFVLGCMYESGCPIKDHVAFHEGNTPIYTYHKNTGAYENGAWDHYKNSTLTDGLSDQNWDVVIFQELHTISGLLSTFTDNNDLETLINYVVNILGYEPQLDWHSVGIIPEIPQAYVDYVSGLDSDGEGGIDAGENEDWEDDGLEEPEDLAWIYDIARPTYPVRWAKNYVKNFNNNAQTMYDAICDVAENYIMKSEVYSFDDVIPGGSVIQYARNMGMTDQELFRDYAHKSDYGRVLIGYVWYASLMDITGFSELKYTTVPAEMRQKKFVQYGDLVLSSEQYDMALNAINYALANPFDSPTPVTAE